MLALCTPCSCSISSHLPLRPLQVIFPPTFSIPLLFLTLSLYLHALPLFQCPFYLLIYSQSIFHMQKLPHHPSSSHSPQPILPVSSLHLSNTIPNCSPLPFPLLPSPAILPSPPLPRPTSLPKKNRRKHQTCLHT